MISWPFRYNSSLRVRDQVGVIPPLVEICHLPPGPGNGRTYTSFRPDSFEEYASQRPSGENIGSSSAKGALRKIVGVPGFHPDASSPPIGRIIRSRLVCGEVSVNAMNLPLGCHEAGD